MANMLTLFLPGAATANDRLKLSFDLWLARSILAAVAFHLAILVLAPRTNIVDYRTDSRPIEHIDVTPPIDIPPPPEPLQRPAIPILNPDVAIDPNLTIAPTVFDDALIGPPPPPPVRGVDTSREPVWVPHEVRPEISNRDEFARALTRRYPGQLRNSGIGGTVVLWVYVEESGAAGQVRVVESSGYQQLDDVARELVSEVARFTPALNRDRRVAVWTQLPVTFQAR